MKNLQPEQQTEKKIWLSPVLLEEVISATNGGEYSTIDSIENARYHS